MERFDVLVLGAGPSGLAAAHALSRNGARVAVIEGAPQCGGLMRGLRRGDFHFDLGRKELYSRFPEVHALWSSLLGTDYRPYEHQCGYLYGEHILEKGSPKGMPPAQAARLLGSYLASQLAPGSRVAFRQEDFYRMKYGQAYYDFFVGGFATKFLDPDFSNRPLAQGPVEVPRFAWLRERGERLAGMAAAVSDDQGTVWRHPARGTGQIVETLEQEARAAGACFYMGSRVVRVQADGASRPRVTFARGEERLELEGQAIMTSMPLPILMPVLEPAPGELLRQPPRRDTRFKRSVALVYLMARGRPSFEHNWLEVNDPSYRVGRIVNYASWGGSMVPEGNTGLCLEYFCVEGDGLFDLPDVPLRDLALAEAQRAKLLDPREVFDSFVVRLPHANAATITDDWQHEWMRQASAHVAAIPGLYDINRPGMDRATLAGLDAATAWMTGTAMPGRTLEAPPESGAVPSGAASASPPAWAGSPT